MIKLQNEEVGIGADRRVEWVESYLHGFQRARLIRKLGGLHTLHPGMLKLESFMEVVTRPMTKAG